VDDNGLKMDMADADLEESVVDMIACHWERSLDGDTNASNRQLADVGVKFLGRYTPFLFLRFFQAFSGTPIGTSAHQTGVNILCPLNLPSR